MTATTLPSNCSPQVFSVCCVYVRVSVIINSPPSAQVAGCVFARLMFCWYYALCCRLCGTSIELLYTSERLLLFAGQQSTVMIIFNLIRSPGWHCFSCRAHSLCVCMQLCTRLCIRTYILTVFCEHHANCLNSFDVRSLAHVGSHSVVVFCVCTPKTIACKCQTVLWYDGTRSCTYRETRLGSFVLPNADTTELRVARTLQCARCILTLAIDVPEEGVTRYGRDNEKDKTAFFVSSYRTY